MGILDGARGIERGLEGSGLEGGAGATEEEKREEGGFHRIDSLPRMIAYRVEAGRGGFVGVGELAGAAGATPMMVGRLGGLGGLEGGFIGLGFRRL